MNTNIDKALILNSIKFHYFLKSDAEFARFLGIKPQTLSSWYSRNTFDIDLLYSKCELIDGNFLLTGEGDIFKKAPHTFWRSDEEIENEQKPVFQKQNINTKGIPLLPLDAFAGIGDSTLPGVNFDTIEERYVIPLFDGIEIDFMIPVRGSSMYPKYSSGDVVACRLINELLFVQWNKVYVIDSNSQGVIMKRLLKAEDSERIICRSDNKEYGDFLVPMNDIRSIALVVGVIRLE